MVLPAGKVWKKTEFSSDKLSTRAGPSLFVYKGSIYMFGGIELYGRQNEIYKLDSENKWEVIQTRGSPPTPRSGIQCVLFNDFVYVYGGATSSDGVYYDDTYKLNLVTFEWIKLTEGTGHARSEYSLTLLDKVCILFGGKNPKRIFNDTRLFDLGTEQWVSISCEISPIYRHSHTAISYNGTVIIFGGSDSVEIYNDICIFNLATRTWVIKEAKGDIIPLYKHSAIRLRNSMYVFGGMTTHQVLSKELYKYNILTSSWSKVICSGEAPSARLFHTALLRGDELIIVGGHDGYQRLNEMYSIQINYDDGDQKSQILHPKPNMQTITHKEFSDKKTFSRSGTLLSHADDYEERSIQYEHEYAWRQLEPKGILFTPRTGHTVSVVKNSFFLFGGADNDNILSDLYQYDVALNTWSLVPGKGTPPKSRSGCKSVAKEDIIYFFGGYTHREGEYFNDLYIFEPKTLTWSYKQVEGEPIPARVDHSIVYLQKALYIFGGTDGKTRFNDLIKINIETWKAKKVKGDGDVPVARFGHTADIFKNHMYIFGGWNGFDTLNELYMYSVVSNIWYEERVNARSKPLPRYRHSSAVIGSSLFIFGGVDKSQVRFDDLHEYNFEKREWRVIETTGTIPSARTFHSCVSHENSLYIVGGNDGKKRNDMYQIKINDAKIFSETASEIGDLSQASFFEGQNKFLLIDEKSSSDRAEKVIKILKEQVNELSKRLKDEQARLFCVECGEKEINAVFLDCGHRCMCYNCSVKYTTCPVCKGKLSRIIKIYTV